MKEYQYKVVITNSITMFSFSFQWSLIAAETPQSPSLLQLRRELEELFKNSKLNGGIRKFCQKGSTRSLKGGSAQGGSEKTFLLRTSLSHPAICSFSFRFWWVWVGVTFLGQEWVGVDESILFVITLRFNFKTYHLQFC